MWLILEDERGASLSAVPVAEGEFVIGRGTACHLVLQGERISRRHATITRAGNKAILKDLGSTMGTRVNGEDVRTASLKAGDRLTIVNRVLRFEMKLPDHLPANSPPSNAGVAPKVAVETTATQPREGDWVDWRPFGAFLNKLRRSADSRDLLVCLLNGLIELFRAQRGFVLLRERSREKLVPVATASLEDTESFVAVSSTVYGRALQEKDVVFIRNTREDVTCQGAASLDPSDVPRTIVCGPLLSKNQAVGVIYIDMPEAEHGIERSHIELFKSITGLASELLAGGETRKRLIEARGKLRSLVALADEGEELVLGDGAAARELNELIASAAPLDVSVLITGDTGTGKEMVARALHRRSSRREGPFIPVNCGALPRDIVEAELFGSEKGAYTGATGRRIGRFELASSGTLFLDEIGELPLETQTSLLRVIQERSLSRVGGNEIVPIDFRLISATNADLKRAVREGTFRQDLYYRINVFKVELKPLRDRPEDILPLASHFLQYFNSRFGRAIKGFTAEAGRLLVDHDWPGNIRELKNAIERAVVVEKEDTIGPRMLPIYQAGTSAGRDPATMETLLSILPRNYPKARDLFERAFLERCLDENDGNIAAAARQAGMSRCAIYRRLSALGLVDKD